MPYAPIKNNKTSPRLPKWARGGLSSLGCLVPWGGRLCGALLNRFRTPERYEQGLVLVLPGIESESFLNHSVVWGLADGGWQGATELEDWTTSCTLLFLYHLRGGRRNALQAQRIADRIVAYQDQYPGRPVHLIGHSGGGALTILILEALPAGRQVTSAILLAAAIAPNYPLQTALSKTERGVWNFWSPLDWFFLGAGTLVFGTLDGQLRCSAGMIGFQEPTDLSEAEQLAYREQLHQERYSPQMARTFNLGGHFGCTNRAFVETWVAPLLTQHSDAEIVVDRSAITTPSE
jgi:pimeloyl-ACP methyl ester carboxylesterase